MQAETELTAARVYATRPSIQVDRQRYALVDDLLLSMELNETQGGLASLELRFAGVVTHADAGLDFAFEFADTDVLALGAELLVAAGDAADPQEIFRGRISAVELVADPPAQPELWVQAEDALMWQRMQRHTRRHRAGPLRDILQALAADTGLTPVITGLELRVDDQLQCNESNLAFLRRLLDDHDADLQVVGQELHISPRARVERGRLTLELGSQLQRVRCRADLAHQVQEITLAGFDVGQGGELAVTSSPQADLGPGRGRGGGDWLTDAFGRRSEHLGERAVYDRAEAQALADAAYARRARRFVTVEGWAEGNPGLRVGAHLRLDKLGPRFSNTYYVTRTCHRFDLVRGYRTGFEAETAFLGD